MKGVPNMATVATQKLEIKLTNSELFAQLLEHNGYSVRSFADAIENKLIRKRSKATISKSTIGHLRSGARRSCNKDVAAAAAELLGLPVKALFESSIEHVTRTVRTNR
jgi:hypothetical protein